MVIPLFDPSLPGRVSQENVGFLATLLAPRVCARHTLAGRSRLATTGHGSRMEKKMDVSLPSGYDWIIIGKNIGKP